ncbi:lysozyme family protein [Carnobacterium inhibens]|uniref:Lysozyme n=1 Tax=Carnobacterium inhibens subsp. gilichinskyi TaxID=1266845 RepID=U5SD42_9LACT|nr:lysozyme family protein [Carnobacterium inhibens]AGY82981.1 lysozyme [Carnobacterium inhibens subsp. gilichinskyi]
MKPLTFYVKSKIGKVLGWSALGLVLLITILVTAFSSYFTGTDENELASIPESVLKWKPIMEEELAKYGMEDYIEIVLAITATESDGSQLDVMQSSEAIGLAPNAIQDPVYSIQIGIKHFKNVIDQMNDTGVDLNTAIQSYNFGSGYLTYIADNGGVHTTELAETYSKEVVAPSLGNTSVQTYPYSASVADEKGNYLYTNGGNFYYADLVQQALTDGVTGNGVLAFPVEDRTITSTFGFRVHPITGENKLHGGVDFAPVSGGNPPVFAALKGKVTQATYSSSWGNYVKLTNGNGIETLYAHLKEVTVLPGQQIETGETIGYMGTSGSSTGVHLHFEVYQNNNRIDPAPLLGL